MILNRCLMFGLLALIITMGAGCAQSSPIPIPTPTATVAPHTPTPTSLQGSRVIDAPNAHIVDDAMVDLGLAVWNTATIYPVITLEEAVGGLPE